MIILDATALPFVVKHLAVTVLLLISEAAPLFLVTRLIVTGRDRRCKPLDFRFLVVFGTHGLQSVELAHRRSTRANRGRLEAARRIRHLRQNLDPYWLNVYLFQVEGPL